jgi:hypothetical protein
MAPTSTADLQGHGDLPLSGRATALALGLSWVPIAVAETLLGDLDALDDVAAMAGGAGRIASAGLLHVLSGVLLAYAAVGLLARLRGRTGGRIGATLVLVLSTCFGAFGMLHLLALETTAADLDPAAMNAFLDRLSEAPGWWSVPVGVVGLLGMPVMALTCLALARSGAVRWWGPAVVTAAALVHFAGLSGALEIAAQWGVVAGLTIVAFDLTRAVRSARTARADVRVPAGG